MTKQNRGAARRWMIGAAIAALTLGEAAASPIVITSVAQLQAVSSSGHYVLGKNLDATGVSFGPLGAFSGTFDGKGHTIANLTESGVGLGGLFSQITASGVVSNLKLSNVSISGGSPVSIVGGITAFNQGTIHDVSVSGSLSGYQAGGIAGYNGVFFHPGGPIDTAVIQRANAQVSLSVISNGNGAGGIASDNYGSIIGSSSSGSATGSGHCSPGTCADVALGGVTANNLGVVADSWSKLGISGSNVVAGGLVGDNLFGGVVAHSWAEGTVAGGGEAVNIGGLIGVMFSGSVLEAYARGAVSGQASGVPADGGFAIDNVGSVFGGLQGGSVDQVYGTGAVNGSATGTGPLFNTVGGFSAQAFNAVVTAGYWDMQSTGQFLSNPPYFPLAIGLTTAQLQSGFYPAGFDPTVWYVKAGYYPQFTPFPSVPEPATLALFGAGLFFARRRRV